MMTFNEDRIVAVLKNSQGETEGVPNRHLIYKMLQAMYQRQTGQEQQIQGTRVVNGIGFGKYDAQFLSDVARKSQKYKRLTPGQAAAVGKALVKYRKQLAQIAAVEAENHAVHNAVVRAAALAGDDTYLCQVCGQVRNGTSAPSQWRPDITGTKSAGNVCPACIKVHEISKQENEILDDVNHMTEEEKQEIRLDQQDGFYDPDDNILEG